jgi:predicted molibdopterin-dependent oxidoreductase YjgC
VQNCFAETETAKLADVVLPSAMWGEKAGCMTDAERRCTLLKKAVEPPQKRELIWMSSRIPRVR